jgi:hypothetical protein
LLEFSLIQLFLDKLSTSNRALFEKFQSVKQTFVVDEKLAKEIDAFFADPGMLEGLPIGAHVSHRAEFLFCFLLLLLLLLL